MSTLNNASLNAIANKLHNDHELMNYLNGSVMVRIC